METARINYCSSIQPVINSRAMQASNPLFLKEFSMDVAVKGSNPAANTEKAKALAAALAQIEKQFGKGLSLIHI